MMSTTSEAALFLSSSVALSILVKATIMLALGFMVTRLAGRSRAALRHIVLAATFGTLLIVPLIVASGNRLPVEIPIFAGSDSTASVTAAPPALNVAPSSRNDAGTAGAERNFRLPSWPALIRFVWIAGTLMFLLPLAANLWRLHRLRRNGLPWPEMQQRLRLLAAEHDVHRPVEVLLHEETPTPLMCGFWRPSIVLPADARDWNEVELRCAVVHELEHVRRGDWIIQSAARVVSACYWFHPLVWIAWRQLCLEAERACDDAVIENAERTDYADQLVSLARRMSTAHAQPAIGMANRSDLARRISAVLDATQHRGRAGLLAIASTVTAAAVIAIVLAPLHAVPQSQGKQQSESPSKQTEARRSSPFDRALYEAAENGEVDDIAVLLNAGANVNCALLGDGSPLIGAAREGHLEAVRFLLDRGADPDMPVPGDGNPLIMAAREGQTAVVELLLDRGALIDVVVPGDENALIQASASGRLPVVKLLVSRGANVNARVWVERNTRSGGGEWRTPLRMARQGGHTEVIAYLVSSGARE